MRHVSAIEVGVGDGRSGALAVVSTNGPDWEALSPFAQWVKPAGETETIGCPPEQTKSDPKIDCGYRPASRSRQTRVPLGAVEVEESKKTQWYSW